MLTRQAGQQLAMNNQSNIFDMATINSMQSTFDTTLTFYFTPEVGRVVLTKNGVPFKVLKPGDVFSVTAKNLRAAREFVDKKCLPVNCLLVS